MFGRDFSLGRHNLPGIIIIIIIILIIINIIMSFVIITKEIIDSKIAYGGKIVKKGIIKIFSLPSKHFRDYKLYDIFYYLVIEDEIGGRKRRYCNAQSYRLCKIGDIVEKKAGFKNNPIPVRADSPYNSDYNSDVPKKPVNKTGSF